MKQAITKLFETKQQGLMLLTAQFTLIGLMYPFLEYGPEALPNIPKNQSVQMVATNNGTIFEKIDENDVNPFYPSYQDMHVMIYVGFGFLMTFLKRYGQSSLGLTFLLGAYFFQVALFSESLFTVDEKGTALLSLDLFIAAEIAIAAVLISFGVVIGKTSFFQLIVMGTIEIAAYSLNRHICMRVFKILDTGGSIVVHMFGAYFGLAASFVFYGWKIKKDPDQKLAIRLNSSYNSDIFAMLGTIILWLYWPTFNSLGLTQDLQMRAIINTVLATSTSCVLSFACSILFNEDNKFLMTHVQNSTLAGGVAIGTIAALIVGPFPAAMIGVAAAVISVLGYIYVTPYLQLKYYIHDTCGVHNLHGLPSIVSATYSVYMAYIAHTDIYHYSLYELYPARAPENGENLHRIQMTYHSRISPGVNRSAETQALYQLASIPTTIVMAILTGLFAGALMSLQMFGKVQDNMLYEDDVIFQLPKGAKDLELLRKVLQIQEDHKDEITSDSDYVRSQAERQNRIRIAERPRTASLQVEERTQITAM